MKLSYMITCIVLIGMLSCKKKKTEPDTSSNTTPATTNSNSSYALLQVGQMTYVSSTYSASGSTANARFSSSALINNGSISGTELNAGTVSLNSVVLKKDQTSGIFYWDSTGTLFTPPAIWTVSGSTVVPAFTQTITGTYPTFTGTAAIQGTISTTQNASIPLAGITGADEIQILMFGTNMPIDKIVPGNSAGINLTAAELSSLGTTTAGILQITASKNSFTTIGGKQYKFQLSQQFIKTNMVFN